jgi:beta-glucosidase
MTLDEKVGQMTQADRGALRSEGDIRTYFLGSVLSGGGSSPPDATAAGWAEMYDRYQAIALQTRLQIPIVYGIDAVHGHNNVRGAVIFPHNVGLGCTRDPALVERVARATAEEVAATGIDWTFSPCIAVARDERWGRTYESFGETPELAVEMGAAAVRGYQPAILACAKHYVADGGTEGGKDQGDARIDEAILRALYFSGFQSAIAAGTATVIVSFSSWNGQKMHGNRYLLADVLKGELGFSGFLVSDWGGIDHLSSTGPTPTGRSSRRSAPRPTARSPGRPCAGRWSCSGTRAACCRSRRWPGASTWRGRTRTTSVTSAGDGRSPGRGRAGRSRPAPRSCRRSAPRSWAGPR